MMSEYLESTSLSQIDYDRFGVVIAKAVHINSSNASEIEEFCRTNRVRMLIARCPSSEIDTVHLLQVKGYLLMDTLVYYSSDLQAHDLAHSTAIVQIRPATIADEVEICAVASESFRNYLGHYHADPRLHRKSCDEVYVSWARNAVLNPKVADIVLVATSTSMIQGFIAIRLNGAGTSEGVLNAVLPSVQGQGIYSALLEHAQKWSISQGMQRMIISTQLTNTRVQNVWTRHGFVMQHAQYTFHKWFELESLP